MPRPAEQRWHARVRGHAPELRVAAANCFSHRAACRLLCTQPRLRICFIWICSAQVREAIKCGAALLADDGCALQAFGLGPHCKHGIHKPAGDYTHHSSYKYYLAGSGAHVLHARHGVRGYQCPQQPGLIVKLEDGV